MLEEKFDLLIKETIKLGEKLDKNTAAILGQKGATATAGGATAKAGTKAAVPVSKHKGADVQAMAGRLQKEVSTAVAKQSIKDTGAADLNDLVTNKADKWDAFMEAAEAKLAPDETEPEADPDQL